MCRPSHGAPELSLENQDGTVMRFENDEDRHALIVGLSLHEKGRISLKKVVTSWPQNGSDAMHHLAHVA